MLSTIAKIIHWIIRIILFVLVLVLILNNMQYVQFNFYGLYTWEMPLIILVAIFLLIGVIIGIIYSFMNSLELRARIKLLKNDLDNERHAKNTASKSKEILNIYKDIDN